MVCILARDAGMAKSPDPLLLEYAAAEGLIVLSHDRNTLVGFARDRIAHGLPMPGLFVSPQSLVGPVIETVLTLWVASDAEEWADCIGFMPW